MPGSVTDNNYNCSFCSKVQNQVKRLIAGPDRVFICDECVELCGQIISQDANTGSKHQNSSLSCWIGQLLHTELPCFHVASC